VKEWNWDRNPCLNGGTGLQLAVEDPNLLAAKGRQYKTIEPLIISSAIIAQQTQSLFLANEEAVDTVGSVVNPRRIAARCDIAGQLVDLVSKRERLTFPRNQVC